MSPFSTTFYASTLHFCSNCMSPLPFRAVRILHDTLPNHPLLPYRFALWHRTILPYLFKLERTPTERKRNCVAKSQRERGLERHGRNVEKGWNLVSVQTQVDGKQIHTRPLPVCASAHRMRHSSSTFFVGAVCLDKKYM